MKQFLSALCMLAITAGASAKQANSLNRSAFSSIATLPANVEATRTTTDNAAKLFPGWTAFTDKINGNFTELVGPAMSMQGAAIKDKAVWCMTHKLQKLGVKQNEWVEINSKLGTDRYVRYHQTINGHSVFGSSLVFRFTETGGLLKVHMKNYGDMGSNAHPAISTDAAKEFAIRDLDGVTVTSCTVNDVWEWFPLPQAGAYELRPVWKYNIIGKYNNMPVILRGYVDAINGSVLYRTDDVKSDFNLTVKGTVYTNGTMNPASLEPLSNLRAEIGVNNFYTDNNGYFSTNALNIPQSPNVYLAGKWSSVVDYGTVSTPIFVDVVNLNNTTYTFPFTAPSSSKHVNAYYHTNKVHDYMKGFFPSFTSLDFSLTTNVDDFTGDCNAYYDGTSINFFAEDFACYSFAELGDVVYHEYGHGISDHMYTDINGISMMNGSMNEANSDIWGLSITHNPIMAQNAFVGPGGFIRRYDMTPQLYPQDWSGNFPDPHYIGQIIAGCWWDVGTNLGNVDSMAKLFTDVYWDAPDGIDGDEAALFRSILIDALLADDNDNNMSNGTPHYSKIVAAFAKHGIYLSGDLFYSFNHQEIGNQPALTPINLSAALSFGIPPYFSKMRVFYKKDNAPTWDSVTLTTNGTNFTGTIPAQQPGTVISYYFAVKDSLGVNDAYFPRAFDPVTPSHQTSLPYQFAVGVVVKDSQNFELPVTDWQIGGNPGDNATTGIWMQTTPTGFNTPWPTGDHTTSLGFSLFTGQPQLTEDVADGTTTVLSPVYNVAGYFKPIMSYYRWFSNDMGENFKNDPWKVMIRDVSNNNWITVENTYQSDLNWRRKIFSVRDYLPATATQVQMKYIISDSTLSNWVDGGQSFTIGGVDDVYLYDATGPNEVNNVPVAHTAVYPNPADEKLIVTTEDINNSGFISLQDITGKEVYRTVLSQGTSKYEINTLNIPAGIYTMRIQNNKSVQTQKITIKHN